MSTDDLTARARAEARYLEMEGYDLTSALVSELADEVDRLRERGRLHREAAETNRRIEEGQLQRIVTLEGECDEWAMQWRGADDMFADMIDKRDVLKAALERIKDLIEDTPITVPVPGGYPPGNYGKMKVYGLEDLRNDLRNVVWSVL